MGTVVIIISIIIILYGVVFPWMDANTRQPNYSEEEKRKIEEEKKEHRKDAFWVFACLAIFFWWLFG